MALCPSRSSVRGGSPEIVTMVPILLYKWPHTESLQIMLFSTYTLFCLTDSTLVSVQWLNRLLLTLSENFPFEIKQTIKCNRGEDIAVLKIKKKKLATVASEQNIHTWVSNLWFYHFYKMRFICTVTYVFMTYTHYQILWQEASNAKSVCLLYMHTADSNVYAVRIYNKTESHLQSCSVMKNTHTVSLFLLYFIFKKEIDS